MTRWCRFRISSSTMCFYSNHAMEFNKLIFNPKVYSVQGMHRMVTLNILGDLSGHGRNGGGERHVRRCRRYGSHDECWCLYWRRNSTCCYQHRAAYLTRPSAISSGVYFDSLFLFSIYSVTWNYFVYIICALLLQVQSVIQPNQQSVIQTASNIQSVQLPKGNVILVSKPSSVIHTTQGTLQTLQVPMLVEH